MQNSVKRKENLELVSGQHARTQKCVRWVNLSKHKRTNLIKGSHFLKM
jgi:hypothetical protein